jgi:hypothetical protein
MDGLVAWQSVRAKMVVVKIVPRDEIIMMMVKAAIIAVMHVPSMERQANADRKVASRRQRSPAAIGIAMPPAYP